MKIENNAGFDEEISVSFFAERTLPIVFTPRKITIDICKWGRANRNFIQDILTEYGGILFRGFNIPSIFTFESFIESVSSSVLEYKERSSPRSKVSGNIYTSTDHPPDKEIFLHSEQSYNLKFPMKIFFYCQQPSEYGGETPIADVRKVYRNIPQDIRNRFEVEGYRYSRYFWSMMGMNWQTAFQTQDRKMVEAYCNDNEIKYQWCDNDCLSTYQIRPTVAKHPISEEACWFNHCTFFNITTLDKPTKDMLTTSFDDHELPNNTYYSDGSKIEEQVMEILRSSYEKEKTEFAWEKNDILMLDNMLTAHGRRRFSGKRKVLVGMSEVCAWADVS